MMPITDTVPASVYENYTPRQIQADLSAGTMPITFTRRMRLLNLVSGVTLNKIPVPYVKPFKVLDIHHALNDAESAESIIAQLDSSAMFQALAVGDIAPLWEEAQTDQKLATSFTQGWTPRFFEEPFDPINVMLAMRSKLLLEVVDELGHSYDLMKMLRLGYIPDEPMDDWPEGGIDDTLPPGIGDPIVFPPGSDPDAPWTEPPEEGEPGYVPPVEGEPGYTPPVEGEPGYTPPEEGEPGYTPPVEGEPGEGPGPGPGEPGGPGGPEGPGAGPGPGPGEPGGPGGPEGPGAGPGGPGAGPGGPGAGPGEGPGSGFFGGVGPGYGGSYGGFSDPFGPLGGGGRSPGAPSGGGGAVDCCVDDDGDPVTLYYEKSELACDETIEVYLYNLEVPCDVDHYEFVLAAGGGTLNLDEDGFLESYTAPATNPGGVNDPTIQLWCDDELMHEFTLTVNDWCVGDDGEPVSIAYTTLQMHIDEYQDIYLTNLKALAPVTEFTFSLAAGDGTLAFDEDGWLTGYTAPHTNVDCLKNPTIAVTCHGSPLDSITIAIDAAGTSYRAYENKWISGTEDVCCAYAGYGCEPGSLPPDCDPQYEYCGQKTYFICAQHYCNGVLLRQCGGTDYVCRYTIPDDVWEYKGTCLAQPGAISCGAGNPLGITDVRSAAAKTAGCCPLALI